MPLMTKEAARRLSALQLAFMGDTVCDLLTRTNLMFRDIKVKDMHVCATQVVNARAQAAALQSVRHLLDEDEADELERTWSQYPNLETIYASKSVLFTTSQNELFKNIKIVVIPDNYFDSEMKEIGESW